MVILHAGEPLGEFGQLKIMSGEQSLGAGARVDIFDRGPGDGKTVVGGGAAADFVEQDQGARRCGVKNRGGFGHLDHEGGAAASQVVAGSDSGEDAVHDAQSRGTCRYEGSHLRQDHDESRLSQISRLAAHVGPGHNQHGVRRGVEIQVIWHEALAAASQFLLLNDGMAAFENFDIA